jgi:hypothetical protein
VILSQLFIFEQGQDLSDSELQAIVTAHDLDHNGVIDEVLVDIQCYRRSSPFYSLRA